MEEVSVRSHMKFLMAKIKAYEFWGLSRSKTSSDTERTL